jgi:molybdate transport system ATP-binding protein
VDALLVDIGLPLRRFDLRVTLEVGAETFALVGPSGAGKSTVLRCVAGLAAPQEGRIALGETTWFDAARRVNRRPEERSVGLVFQEYALFPHLSVRQNVAYGGRRRVDDLLERFRIAHLARARPRQISGGERQRVALARALSREPAVLLLDEPMAALDPHTRVGVRGELRELLHEIGLPTILVTHDFEDAAALADRVGVIVDGRIVQVGTPADLVAAPSDRFVASFTGAPVLVGRAEPAANGLTRVMLEDGTTLFSADEAQGVVGVVVHPWDVTISRNAADDSSLNHVAGEIVTLVPLGNRTRVRVGAVTAEVTAASAERLGLAEGERVVASFKATGTRLVPLA